MKKILNILIILFCIGVYYCSNNVYIIEEFTTWREKKDFIGSEYKRYGGLYGQTNLSQFRQRLKYTPKQFNQSQKQYNLFLISDSYLHHIVEENNFKNINKLYKIKWWEVDSFRKLNHLDTSKKNVLLIEMTERNFRSSWTEPYAILNMLQLDSTYMGDELYLKETTNETSDWLTKHLYNPNINQNLELNLFDYSLFYPIKELKSYLNHTILKRPIVNAYLDTENQFLFYRATLEGQQSQNSFYPIQTNELAQICKTINQVADYYKQKGFDDVYLSIIPNPVTLINPRLGNYNQLIPNIQNCDTLRIKIMDVYTLFKQTPQHYYAPNDTHWNNNGLQKWLDHWNRNF